MGISRTVTVEEWGQNCISCWMHVGPSGTGRIFSLESYPISIIPPVLNTHTSLLSRRCYTYKYMYESLNKYKYSNMLILEFEADWLEQAFFERQLSGCSAII